MRSRLVSLLPALILAALPRSGHAQELGFLTSIFKNVHSVVIYFQGSEISASREASTENTPCWGNDILCGAGAELLIDVAGGGNGVHFELGLGGSYLRGLSALSNDIDLRGSVRSFPTIAAYVLKETEGSLSPYAGLSFGISDLWNAQVYTRSGREISLKSQTFDYGIIAGSAIDIARISGLFIEFGYKVRRFSSVDYGADEVLSTYPRELGLSGVYGMVGWQFDISNEKNPPAFQGAWNLNRLDGLPLPGLLEQRVGQWEEAPGAQSRRVEITTGELRLEEDKTNRTYVLELRQRAVYIDGSGRQIAVLPLPDDVETGTFEITGGVLELTSADAAKIRKYQPLRLDDELQLRVDDRGRVLVFRKVAR